MLLYFQCFELG